MCLLAIPYAELDAIGRLLLVVVSFPLLLLLLLLVLLALLGLRLLLLVPAHLALLLIHLLVHERLEPLGLSILPAQVLHTRFDFLTQPHDFIIVQLFSVGSVKIL